MAILPDFRPPPGSTPAPVQGAGMNAPPVTYIFSAILVIGALAIFAAGHGNIGAVVLGGLLVLIAILLPAWLKMVDQWQRAVVLRLGRYQGLRGPGLFFLIPFFETIAVTIDVRIRTTEIRAEEALTRDTVAIGIEAIVFWQVRDPAKAATEIENYVLAVEQVAQTSLREVIGAQDLTGLLSDRAAADAAIRRVIASKTERWGVEVTSVEIKDIGIPPSLQDAMSRQAQAEREKQARETLASAEILVAEKVREAAAIYASDPIALKLRQMNLVYEMNKERGTTILIPTDLASALGTLAPIVPPSA